MHVFHTTLGPLIISQPGTFWVCKADNDPRSYAHILNLGIWEYHFIWKKSLCRCDYVDDFEMGRWSWIIWWTLNTITSILSREAEEEVIHTHWRTHTHTHTHTPDKVEIRATNQGKLAVSRNSEAMKQMLPKSLQRECGPTNSLVWPSDSWFWTSPEFWINFYLL